MMTMADIIDQSRCGTMKKPHLLALWPVASQIVKGRFGQNVPP